MSGAGNIEGFKFPLKEHLHYLDLAPVGNSAIPGAEIQIWEDSSRIYARTIFRGHTSVTTTVL